MKSSNFGLLLLKDFLSAIIRGTAFYILFFVVNPNYGWKQLLLCYVAGYIWELADDK